MGVLEEASPMTTDGLKASWFTYLLPIAFSQKFCTGKSTFKKLKLSCLDEEGEAGLEAEAQVFHNHLLAKMHGYLD